MNGLPAKQNSFIDLRWDILAVSRPFASSKTVGIKLIITCRQNRR